MKRSTKTISEWVRLTREAMKDMPAEQIALITLPDIEDAFRRSHRRRKPPVVNEDIKRFVNSFEDQLGVRFTPGMIRLAFLAAPSLRKSVGPSLNQLISDTVNRRHKRHRPTEYRGK